MKRKSFVAGTGAAFAAAALPSVASAASRDVLVYGAKIHTVDRANAHAEAFVIRNGRFAYVGSLAGAQAFAARGAERIALHGLTVLPGLIDAHIHLQSVGLDLAEVNLHHIASYEAVVQKAAAFARSSPDDWILGQGWDQNLWPGRAFPTSEPLTKDIPDRFVVLERVDGHAVLVNEKVLRFAGITSATPDPPGGRILRDASGAPTGVFVDNAMELIYRVVPPATVAQLTRATAKAMKLCASYGLTSIGQPGIGADGIAAYHNVANNGELTMRSHLMLADEPELLDEYLARGPTAELYDSRLSIRAIKMFADGALGSRGAALLEPYSDDPGNRGLVRTPQQHMQDAAERALRQGFQVGVHAIGDRGNRMVLDAYEAALRTHPVRGHRFRVEHAQVLSEQDIPRFAQLSLIPSMQTTHQISDMGWAQRRLGADRIKGAYAWRSLLRTGVVIANGTDAPVEEVNPLRTFHAGISRQNEANQPPGGWYPDQKMTREETLKSMTLWAAYANFQEQVTGSITSGKFADFVVIDRDWMTVPPEAIMGTKILATYFNGSRVYESSGAPPQVSMRGIRSRRYHGCSCQSR